VTLADVGDDSAQLHDRTGVVAHEVDAIAHADDLAVCAHHAVLDLVIAPRLRLLGAEADAALAIIRVEMREPEARPVDHPLGNRVAEQSLGACADEEEPKRR
jgi:hypothetical protein